ncbi:hypothetical protein QJQ45_016358 [Haematococcus lacustris]|nr:hypothetical protein QJQ45_016358 [Haematococcus lacustris]
MNPLLEVTLHNARTAATVDGQQQQPVGVWQCRLQVAAGCRCAAVHEQQQQDAVHVFQCMSIGSWEAAASCKCVAVQVATGCRCASVHE